MNGDRLQARQPSPAIRHELDTARITGDQVDHVFVGHVIQAGAGQITARQAAVKGRSRVVSP
jgi:hypothetical protein